MDSSSLRQVRETWCYCLRTWLLPARPRNRSRSFRRLEVTAHSHRGGWWVTETSSMLERYFSIPRICALSRPFSSPDACHNQTDPLPKGAFMSCTLGRVVDMVGGQAANTAGKRDSLRPPEGKMSYGACNLGGTMDDDKEEKSIIEKFSEKAKGIVDTASTAAMKAMEPDPEHVAGTTNEQVYIPEATDAAAMPVPLISAPKSPKKRAPPSMSGRTTPMPDSPMPSPKKKKTKVAVKKAAKKTAKRPAKKPKSSAGRKAIGKKKTAKKALKKKKAKRG
jgi:hypothetical protein